MTTKPDPATMTGDEILAEIRAALPAIREIPTSPSDPGWPGPVASNLASLNELVAELVGALADRGISDPEFADMVRRIFRDHSHRLGFEFRGEPFFGDGGDLLDRMVEEILAVSSPTGGTDYEEQKWKRAVRGIAARIFRAGMASGWDKHRAAPPAGDRARTPGRRSLDGDPVGDRGDFPSLRPGTPRRVRPGGTVRRPGPGLPDLLRRGPDPGRCERRRVAYAALPGLSR